LKLQNIITAVQEYYPNPDVEAIRRAYAFVKRYHQGQTRASGEPYITHVTEVAFLATKLRLDIPSIVTALLHDTVEDTSATLEDISKEFGEDVKSLVDGVTKLSKVTFSSKAEEQAENFRKMLLAMAADIRVLLIKLCDRTHNMRTLEFLSEARRFRIAQETIEIYAPLAHRLGIHWMKSELEDLAFRFLKPDIFEHIKQQVSEKKEERERYIQQVVALISRELEQNKVKGKVSGRSKHFYSIFQKMESQKLTFDEIYDLIAFRIIVPSMMDCYAALGVIHSAWKPIPGRFKDYIAMPKANNYQSLHTTVIGPYGARIEIQIRTAKMHDIAEKGIAAHWVYKEDGGGKTPSRQDLQLPWLKDLIESEKHLRDPLEFMSIVKEDLFPDEVFVFSPKGDVLALNSGATPIDFAYHIHSEVGHHCVGARVNGQQVPLSYRLQNGDAVEIITAKPSITKQRLAKSCNNI
jgi:GTP diphosphokinase / guanosine-3',5'-bis(diphosphate) 3'-diphosphatase